MRRYVIGKDVLVVGEGREEVEVLRGFGVHWGCKFGV